MTTPRPFRQADAAWRWWNSLQPKSAPDGHHSPGDRAVLARLRRCASPLEAAMEPVTIELFQALGFQSPEANLERVAALAIVLSFVRVSTNDKFARALGPSSDKADDAKLKPLRFRRLLGARGVEETLVAFRRAVQLLGGAANVTNLAELILAWNEDGAGDRVRVRFAFDYYNAGAHAPSRRNSEAKHEETQR